MFETGTDEHNNNNNNVPTTTEEDNVASNNYYTNNLLEKLPEISGSRNKAIFLRGLADLDVCEKNCFWLRMDGKEQDIVRRRWLVSKGIDALR